MQLKNRFTKGLFQVTLNLTEHQQDQWFRKPRYQELNRRTLQATGASHAYAGKLIIETYAQQKASSSWLDKSFSANKL